MVLVTKGAGGRLHRWLTYLRQHVATLGVAVAAAVAWLLWYPHRPRGLGDEHATLTLAIGLGVIVLVAVSWLVWHSRWVSRGRGADGLAATGTLVAVSIVFLVGAVVELLAVLNGISPHALHQTILVLDVVLAAAAALASRWLGSGDGTDR